MLPNFNAITTSIQFHPKRNVVGVTLSSNLFFFYDIDQRNITSWSQKNSQLIPAHLVDRTEPIMGMVFDTVRDEHVILFGASFILTVDLTKPVLKDHPLFHSRKQQAFLIDHRFQNIMHIDVIRAEKGSSQPGDCAELVVFERPQLDFIKELPQPFNKQKYGT